MKRAWIGTGALAGASLLVSTWAKADESTMLETPARTSGRSSQMFEMEVRAALYQARVDDQPGLTGTPYKSTFGDGVRAEVGVEFDWQALRIPHIGNLGPGISIGYTKATGIAQRTDKGTPASEETTSLEILPMYAVGVFRLDGPLHDFGIPFVPYAKAGVGYALWRASNTGGTSVAPNGVVGKGHTLGTQLALGLQFSLGIIDEHASQQLDESTGINGTYIFAEYMLSDLTGIGQTNAMYVGTHSFVFGLAFEF